MNLPKNRSIPEPIPDNSDAKADSSPRCPSCFRKVAPDVEHCPGCGYPVAPPTRTDTQTQQLHRLPTALPALAVGTDNFPDHASAILQFLPSGTCVTLVLKHPIVLGRGIAPDIDQVLDLTGFHAMRHGVSRQHCKLERQEGHLLITDLGSANGTYLNHGPLLPHRAYVVKHGDQIVVGTLHMFVVFSTAETH
jgi:hypothetical protein